MLQAMISSWFAHAKLHRTGAIVVAARAEGRLKTIEYDPVPRVRVSSLLTHHLTYSW